MIILAFISLCLGIESGLNQPIIGLDYDLNGGISFGAFVENAHNGIRTNLLFQGLYFQGKNPGYSLSAYGISIGALKDNWRFTPFLGCGIAYILRELNKNKEWGMGFSYSFGFFFHFRYENITLRPIFYYEGITDFRDMGGYIGTKLRVGYEW